MSIEHIKMGPDGMDGVISLYAIPEEWAQNDELFKAWWLPKTEIGPDGLSRIVRDARISDEAKAGRLLMEPKHNLITNLGITLYLTNLSNGTQHPFTQILSVGNGAISGVTRSDTAVAGDAFGSNARRAQTGYVIVGFQSTVTFSYASGDCNGTWTNCGIYGYKVSSSQNATTSAGTGDLMTHALFPFVKGATAIAVNYAYIMSN